jgi:phosphatidylinositol alpha-1,6-mannosyltransferase
MHIGVVAPEYPPEVGGMQTYAVEFVRALSKRGFTVTVFTRAGDGTCEALPGVRVLRVLRERRRLDRPILDTPGIDAWHVMNACYAWLAEEAAPVVVSVHGNDFLAAYIPVERPALDRLPLLWRSAMLRPALESWLGRWLTRHSIARALPRARAILANSRYTGQVLEKRIPACSGKVIPAMVGVSPSFLAPSLAAKANQVPALITVCRLDEARKNVDLVLKALARLAGDFPFHYHVIGDGQERTALQALADQLGLRSRVTFHGRLAFDALRENLARADLFILTASISEGSHEGFGIAYIEANACGTPTLAARLAGAAEAVAEGQSGYFVDTPSVEGIEAALGRFLSGGIRFQPETCREFARRFSWDRVVDAALPYYGTVS